MGETTRIEYKEMLTPELDIEKEVIAFLNYKEGGFIYIGIDKHGNTVGVNDVDDCMLRLKDRRKVAKKQKSGQKNGQKNGQKKLGKLLILLKRTIQ